MKKLIALIYIFTSLQFFAQITIDNPLSPAQLVQNVLVGTGVQVSNIQFTGDDLQIGKFDNGNFASNFVSGIIISTGNVNYAPGPNNETSDFDGDFQNAGDPDLDDILNPITSNDAAILEFDFIPVSDTISFEFSFASEEYMEFVGQGINDVFGFFISGPGINGPFQNNAKNIALITGTSTSVSIDNVNLNQNAQFYIDNENPVGQVIQYDGYTVPFTAISEVQCGQTYHLKIAIADGFDDVISSAVFLRAKSLNATDIDFKFASITGDTAFYEGCTPVEFLLTRPSSQTADSLIINLNVSGSATMGQDYTQIPTSITFAIGEDSVYVPFETFSDDIIEGIDTITISTFVISECGDSVEIKRSITIQDGLKIDNIIPYSTQTCIDNGSAVVQTSLNQGPVSFAWYQDSLTILNQTDSISGLNNEKYYIFVTDNVCTDLDSIVINELDSVQASLNLISPNPTVGPLPLTVTFGNQSEFASNYEWDFGNGENLLTDNLDNASSSYPSNSFYTSRLVAFQGICSDTAYLTFEVLSIPSIQNTNVFTINEDGINETFTLRPKNFKTFDYKIFNRWGNLIFETNLNQPNWDGKTLNGETVLPGTYFYTYFGEGIDGTILKGQDFLTIIKE